MKFVIQRVKNASVTIDNKLYSSINKGLLVFFCAEKNDENNAVYSGKNLTPDEVLEYFADKILKLRIFEDENGKMNRSLLDINGEILVVSQFTLAANCKKGTRPSFDNAMEPKTAKKMYEDFIQILKTRIKTLSPSLQNLKKGLLESLTNHGALKSPDIGASDVEFNPKKPVLSEFDAIYDNMNTENLLPAADGTSLAVNLNPQASNGPHAPRIKTGVFAADMQISLINDGPVTIIL